MLGFILVGHLGESLLEMKAFVDVCEYGRKYQVQWNIIFIMWDEKPFRFGLPALLTHQVYRLFRHSNGV